MRFGFTIGVIGLAVTMAPVAMAETVYDRLFKMGTLDGLAPGDHVVYDLTTDVGSANFPPLVAMISMDVSEDAKLEIEREEPTGKRVLGTFPQATGNPMNMYFLEQVIAMLAQETGGSVFYLRNNFKEALGDEIGGDVACAGSFRDDEACIVMRPFVNDPNEDKLGRFANLQIEAVLDDADPAFLIGMEAVMPGDADGFVYKLEKQEAANE